MTQQNDLLEQLPELDAERAAEKVLEKADAEARFRKYGGRWAVAVTVIAVAMSIFHLYTSGFGTLMAMKQRSVHLAFLVLLTFLLYPGSKRAPRNRPSVVDWIWIILSVSSSLYIFFTFEAFSMRGTAIPLDITMGAILIVCVLEATRRSVGKELMILALLFLAYGYWGEYIPGVLGHTGFTYKRIVYQLFLSSEGIFGISLGVSATYIFLFILFGAFLTETGMGRFIKDLAMSLAGRTIGGEAKVSIVASGLMGMINGSAVGNVAATGTFTIPLMTGAGFKPVFAAAVVAVAGTGGMIMPPVMWAASFIMAEFLGLHYGVIMLAAAIPAVLYYLAEYAVIHIEAVKMGMKPIPRDEIIPLTKVMRERGHLLVPIIVIVYLLLIGRTPLYAAFYGIISSIAVSFLTKATRLTWKSFFKAMESGARQSVGVGIACAVVGNIIGITNLTGLGLVLGDNIVSLAGGSVLITTFLTMIVCVILGMGLPTTACYIVTATIAAPALMKLGVNPLAAHMFTYYFACLSNLTPPVAIASYGAAGLSGQSPSAVGWTGFRISLAGFLIPFTFIFNPELLLVGGDYVSITISTITSIIGVIALASSLQNFLYVRMNLIQRAGMFFGALLLIFPGLTTDIAGVALTGTVFFWQRMQARSRAL
ncbi:MAG TPA: TRAP transporter permease [Aminobacteriaceae bacterium]|nr:TRAP transporter permease [Aminobacteriaceae bacterium]